MKYYDIYIIISQYELEIISKNNGEMSNHVYIYIYILNLNSF